MICFGICFEVMKLSKDRSYLKVKFRWPKNELSSERTSAQKFSTIAQVHALQPERNDLVVLEGRGEEGREEREEEVRPRPPRAMPFSRS